MAKILTLDKAGRIVLPKAVREELQLAPGDSLQLEISGEQVTLRPLRGNAQLRKERGVWVFYAGEPISEAIVEETRQRVYREREEQFLGKRR